MILMYTEGWEAPLQTLSERKEINPLSPTRSFVLKDVFYQRVKRVLYFLCVFSSVLLYLTQLHTPCQLLRFTQQTHHDLEQNLGIEEEQRGWTESCTAMVLRQVGFRDGRKRQKQRCRCLRQKEEYGRTLHNFPSRASKYSSLAKSFSSPIHLLIATALKTVFLSSLH